MKLQHRFFIVLVAVFLCGNVFAVSPYATTIEQNVRGQSFLKPASFPTTVADASFITRMESKRQGYLPYFNRSAFSDLSIEEQDELEQMARRAEAHRNNDFHSMPRTEYCQNYPADDTNCPSDPELQSPHVHTPKVLPETIYAIATPQITPPTNPTINPQVSSNKFMSMALTPWNISRYNLKTHNGGCTPPERSNHWSNKILTTGQYASSNAPFEKFMITVFRKEGGCINDPNDHGGYTCYGCASRGLCSGINMENITRGTVENLAYNKIYTMYGIGQLPDAFRGYALWGIWGSGAIVGIKQFQAALGVPLTGKIDTTTIRAAENYIGDFATAYTKNREQFYRNIVARDSSQKKFLNGWLNALSLLQTSGCHVVPQNPIYR